MTERYMKNYSTTATTERHKWVRSLSFVFPHNKQKFSCYKKRNEEIMGSSGQKEVPGLAFVDLSSSNVNR